jgi:hypothetical protein
VHTWSSDVKVGADIYIEGNADDIFIFKTTGSLEVATAVNMILKSSDTARSPVESFPSPANIVWQIAGTATVEASAHVEGVLLVKNAVIFRASASLNGRILTQTHTALEFATINAPSKKADTVTDNGPNDNGTTSSPNTLDDDASLRNTLIAVSVVVGVVALVAIGAAAYFYAKVLRLTAATSKATRPMTSAA